MRGWPRSVPEHLKYYYNLRNSLNSQDGCLFYGDRVVIPKLLQSIVLKMLHANHDGIVRGKMLGRSLFWWKNMQGDIENYFKNCEICDQRRNVPTEKVTSKWPKTSCPMDRIHIDFFAFEGKTFLIIVDSFSKFIEAKLMSSTNADQVNEKLEDFFKFFGLPKEIVSDNGPPFNSFDFVNHWETRNVKVTKSPVYHPQSNGTAERGVQTVKNFLKKRLLDQQLNSKNLSRKLNEILAWYNSTPTTVTSLSPSELILRYRPRTVLTGINPKANSSVEQSNRNTRQVRFDESKNETIVYDAGNRKIAIDKEIPEKQFKKGERVMYRNHLKEVVRWIPVVVIDKIGKFLYKIKFIENGNIRIVHVNQLRHKNSFIESNLTKLPEKFVDQSRCKRRRSDSGNGIHAPTPKYLKRRSESMSDELMLRRSARESRPPVRFGFDEL